MRFASIPANSDTGCCLAHRNMDRAPGVASQSICEFHRSRHSENGHHSAILRSQLSFYTCATCQEACDWPSHNVTVQLMTEKAVGTSQIENNRENGPKWGKNDVKCNKGERK